MLPPVKSMQKIRIALFALIVSVAAGCAGIRNAPYVASPGDVEPGEGILYGRFELDEDAALPIAVWFREVNTGKSVYIYMDKEKPIRMARVPVGSYRLVGSILTKKGLSETAAKADTDWAKFNQAPEAFEVEAGKAYYVGEYRGWSYRGVGGFGGRAIFMEPQYELTTTALAAAAPWVREMEPRPAWNLNDASPRDITPQRAKELGQQVSLHGSRPIATAISIGLGFAGGGDDLLARTGNPLGPDRTLRAGTGLVSSFGFKWTPIWSSDYRNGLGFGADLGMKIASTPGEPFATFFSLPVTLSARYLRRVSPRWFLVAAGGAQYAPYSSLDVSETSTRLDGSLGLTGEAGVRVEESGFGIDVTALYTRVTYEVQGTSVDGSSLGILLSMHVSDF